MKEETVVEALQSARARLKSPFGTFAELKSVLCDALDALDLVPPGHASATSSSSTPVGAAQLSSKSRDGVSKQLSGIHNALFATVLPVWSAHLEDDAESWELLEQLVAPARTSSQPVGNGKAPGHRDLGAMVALSSYYAMSTCLSARDTKGFVLVTILKLGARLVTRYGLQDIYWSIHEFDSGVTLANLKTATAARSTLAWEEALSAVVGLPARVANAVGRIEQEGGTRARLDVAQVLENRPYFDRLCVDLEELALRLSAVSRSDSAPLAALITKLHRTGLFQPPSPARIDSRHPTFFTPLFPALLSHLPTTKADGKTGGYPSGFWPSLLQVLPTPVFVTLAWSFLLHLTAHIPASKGSDLREASRDIATAASYLSDMVGPPLPTGLLWQPLLSEVFLTRAKGREDAEGMEARVRVIMAWIGRGEESAWSNFLDRLVEIWSDTKEIKFGLFGRLKYITHLLILTLSLFPFGHPKLAGLAFHSSLLLSIQHYLSHSDPAVRRLGMLVAEVVSGMTVQESEADRRLREERNTEREKKRRRTVDRKAKQGAVDEFEDMMGDLDLEQDKAGSRSKPSSTTGGPKVQRLDFGPTIWDGVGEGREDCRYLRSFVGLRDASVGVDASDDALLGWAQHATTRQDHAEAVRSDDTGAPARQTLARGRSPGRSKKSRAGARATPDSDDESLIGYSSRSEPSSSRSPSPTPSYLQEVADDPMLNMKTREKVERPVYIPQLVDLLKAREEPDKLEVATKWGEALIRRKRDFGKELAENSSELATALLNLNDNFDLDDFEQRRLGMLIALVAAVPKIVAPRIIELYFDAQYSLTQRSAILTGLAMGAREAAGMPTVVKAIASKVDFPSKLLPPALHRQYIEENKQRASSSAFSLLDATAQDLGKQLLGRKGKEAEDRVEEQFVRQRQLRVGPNYKRGTVQTSGLDVDVAIAVPRAVTPYRDVAAEYFILPMINRFWNYFGSAVAREARNRGSQYAAGAGLVLSPFAVAKFLSTLAIMVHAARLSTAYLAVIAPATLELALMVGSMLRGDDEADALVQQRSKGPHADADVVGSALELALVTLDTSKDLDGGRTLSTDHMDALVATGNWAGKIFEAEERGELTTINAGGKSEGRTRQAAAGVVVLISEIVDQSRHLRGWTMS